MKHIISIVFLLVVCCVTSVAQQTNFVIRGHLSGLKKGVTLSVLSAENRPDGSPDYSDIATATVSKSGEFLLSGHVDHPLFVTLTTNNLDMLGDKAEKDNYKQVHWSYTPMWLEPAEYVIKAGKYSLLTDAPITDECVIEGGQTQQDFNELNLAKKAAGITEFDPDMQKLAEVEDVFIKSHPASPVSLFIADQRLTNGYNLSVSQIDELAATITSCPADTARYARFRHRLEVARLTANGNPIVDLPMVTPSGEPCQLDSVTRHYSGRYLLVDFWASWCGICRAGTPVIKEYYSQYPREQFDVISVSSDEKDDAWRAAMAKDDMPWPQYCLTPQGMKDLMSKYQIVGVPYYLIVSPDGKVIANPGRVDEIGDLLKKVLK